MKFLVVLALAFVATQAAFTGSLVEQAQPLVRDLKIVGLARSSAEANFNTQLGGAIGDQINNVLHQIQTTVNHIQNVAGAVQNGVANAIQQAAQLGQQALQQAQGIISDLLSNILGSLFSGNRMNRHEFSQGALAIIQGIVDSGMIQSTQLYQCLTSGDDALDLSLDNLMALHDGGLGAAIGHAQSVNARGKLKACIDEIGLDVIHDVIRPYVQFLSQLLQSLNAGGMVTNALQAILGDELFDIYVRPVLPGNRGLFDGLANAASQFGQMITGIAQNAVAALKEKIEAIKELAAQYIQNGLITAASFTIQTAQDILAALEPIKEDLGLIYDQLVDKFTSIYTDLVAPL